MPPKSKSKSKRKVKRKLKKIGKGRAMYPVRGTGMGRGNMGGGGPYYLTREVVYMGAGVEKPKPEPTTEMAWQDGQKLPADVKLPKAGQPPPRNGSGRIVEFQDVSSDDMMGGHREPNRQPSHAPVRVEEVVNDPMVGIEQQQKPGPRKKPLTRVLDLMSRLGPVAAPPPVSQPSIPKKPAPARAAVRPMGSGGIGVPEEQGFEVPMEIDDEIPAIQVAPTPNNRQAQALVPGEDRAMQIARLNAEVSRRQDEEEAESKTPELPEELRGGPQLPPNKRSRLHITIPPLETGAKEIVPGVVRKANGRVFVYGTGEVAHLNSQLPPNHLAPVPSGVKRKGPEEPEKSEPSAVRQRSSLEAIGVKRKGPDEAEESEPSAVRQRSSLEAIGVKRKGRRLEKLPPQHRNKFARRDNGNQE
jgi:hypothetical protein